MHRPVHTRACVCVCVHAYMLAHTYASTSDHTHAFSHLSRYSGVQYRRLYTCPCGHASESRALRALAHAWRSRAQACATSARVYRHVCRQVCGHVHRQVFRHVCRHILGSGEQLRTHKLRACMSASAHARVHLAVTGRWVWHFSNNGIYYTKNILVGCLLTF